MGGEFSLIERIRARAGSRPDVVLGIGDDAAILRVPPGHDLVVSTDTLVSGVHFPADTPADDIGWKTLAVNLSDLSAMGAAPAWVTLALTLPDADEDWVDAFLEGFMSLAAEHEVALVGGDTTRGPLALSVCAHGFVPSGAALRRDGAQLNDDIWVTGSLGDAAAGLAQWRGKGLASAKLRHRLDRPTPRVAAGISLRGLATSAIDLSDGLVADLGHVLRASAQPGAEIDLGRLPTTRTLAEHFPSEPERWRLQVAGGDDYELCFTAPAANALAIENAMSACDTAATVVGRIGGVQGLRLLTPDLEPFELAHAGFEHFRGRIN